MTLAEMYQPGDEIFLFRTDSVARRVEAAKVRNITPKGRIGVVTSKGDHRIAFTADGREVGGGWTGRWIVGPEEAKALLPIVELEMRRENHRRHYYALYSALEKMRVDRTAPEVLIKQLDDMRQAVIDYNGAKKE